MYAKHNNSLYELNSLLLKSFHTLLENKIPKKLIIYDNC